MDSTIPRYPGTVPGCPYGWDSTIPRHYVSQVSRDCPGMSLWWGLHNPQTLRIPGILGLSRDIPMVGTPQSPDTKYPRYPGTVPGCPYGGDSIIPRHYKYPRYPGTIPGCPWWGLHNPQILSIPCILGLTQDVPIPNLPHCVLSYRISH